MGLEMSEQIVGVFQRSLPPASKMEYNPGFELSLEVSRWFYYRHRHSLRCAAILGVIDLDRVMLAAYRDVYHNYKKYWDTFFNTVVVPQIREFKDMFRDVLAEIELLR